MSPFKLWIYKRLTGWLPETRCFGMKAWLLSWAGAKVGQNVRIGSSATIVGDGELEIGDDVWIGANVLIVSVGPAKVMLGSHIDVGPGVMILTGSHKIDPIGEHIGGVGFSADVVVGDGCWLGARSTILSGVSLAEKTLVGAGSVVIKDVVQECCLVTGVPAQTKKLLTKDDQKD